MCPLETRRDVQQALVELLTPAVAHFSPARARVRFGYQCGHHGHDAAEVEGFARLLWGVAPLIAGGYDYPGVDMFVEGLVHGTTPAHPEFWGVPEDYDSRLVEAAAVAYALIVAPHVFWDRLSVEARKNVATWLGHINQRKVHDNNWLFFRILVNVGLRSVDAPFDDDLMKSDLARVDAFYAGDGWYHDGPGGPRDYYNSFVFHFYALLYARVMASVDRERAAEIYERARCFASEFMQWFSSDGSCVPYGRSLVYRHAQASFWSALVLADVEVVPWGIAKGLVLRHLRWWSQQPVLDAGVLTIGYAYPSTQLAEQYVSAASPYWALKAFAVLAVPDSHPFWSSREQALPPLPATTILKSVRMIVCRDGDHVVALSAGQASRSKPRHSGEKYAKFCYSTHFGFSVPYAYPGVDFSSPDNTLLLSDDKEWLRGPRNPEPVDDDGRDGRALVSTWRPWPTVIVTTWLIPIESWHVRIHRLLTDRLLFSYEGGFAIDRDGDARSGAGEAGAPQSAEGTGHARVSTRAGRTRIEDASPFSRRGTIVRGAPGTNVMFIRSMIPVLLGSHPRGEHWLACSVGAWPGLAGREKTAPQCRITIGAVTVLDEEGRELFRLSK